MGLRLTFYGIEEVQEAASLFVGRERPFGQLILFASRTIKGTMTKVIAKSHQGDYLCKVCC